MKVICVTGTPGTGKSTHAKRIAKAKGYKYIDVNEIIKQNKLKESYDKKKSCYVVDIKKLNKVMIKMIKESDEKGLVIDSHMSHYLPAKYVDLCVVTKCDLKKLESRLKKRKYTKSKIRENLDCEIFDVCLNESKENKHKIKIIDTTRIRLR